MSHRHCGVLPRGEVTYDPANDIDQDGVDDLDTYDDNTFALVYTTAGIVRADRSHVVTPSHSHLNSYHVTRFTRLIFHPQF